LEDLGVKRRIILNIDGKEMGLEGMGWIHLVVDRDQWRAVLKSVNGSLSSIKCWEFLDKLRNY
jgi:hypothetical protein